MNLIGVVGIGGLSLNFTGGVKLFEAIKKNKSGADKFGSLVNPFGAEGDKGGIGGTFIIDVINNTTEAAIQTGAKSRRTGRS